MSNRRCLPSWGTDLKRRRAQPTGSGQRILVQDDARPGLAGTTRSPAASTSSRLASMKSAAQGTHEGVSKGYSSTGRPDAGRETDVHQQPDPALRRRVRGEATSTSPGRASAKVLAHEIPTQQHRRVGRRLSAPSYEQRRQLVKAPHHLAAGDTYRPSARSPGAPSDRIPPSGSSSQTGRARPSWATMSRAGGPGPARVVAATPDPGPTDRRDQRHSRSAPHRPDPAEPVSRSRVDPELHGPQSHGPRIVRDRNPRAARPSAPSNRRPQPVGHATEEARHGHAVDMGGDVPDAARTVATARGRGTRRSERPRGGRWRVGPHHEHSDMLETRPSCRPTRRCAGLVGVDEHERRRIAPSGDGIQNSGEGGSSGRPRRTSSIRLIFTGCG